jgi:hypothetical protein
VHSLANFILSLAYIVFAGGNIVCCVGFHRDTKSCSARYTQIRSERQQTTFWADCFGNWYGFHSIMSPYALEHNIIMDTNSQMPHPFSWSRQQLIINFMCCLLFYIWSKYMSCVWLNSMTDCFWHENLHVLAQPLRTLKIPWSITTDVCMVYVFQQQRNIPY